MPDPVIRVVFPRTIAFSGAGGGASDHGALSGLGDDDHTQYLNTTRGDARYPLKTAGSLAGVTSFSMLFPDGTIHRILPRVSGGFYTLDVEQTPQA
jgi:hypothetical protein